MFPPPSFFYAEKKFSWFIHIHVLIFRHIYTCSLGYMLSLFLVLKMQAWYQVRQCISAVVVTSMRTNSLSHSSHLLDTYMAIVKSLLQAQLDHIKLRPSLEPPSNFDDLSLFSGCLMKQACKNSQSRRYSEMVALFRWTTTLYLTLFSLSLSPLPPFIPLSLSAQAVCYSSWCSA